MDVQEKKDNFVFIQGFLLFFCFIINYILHRLVNHGKNYIYFSRYNSETASKHLSVFISNDPA